MSEGEKMMKKTLALLLALVLIFACFAGCAKPAAQESTEPAASSAPAANTTPESTEPAAPPAIEKKACFITQHPRGDDFVEMIWDGFTQLESDGWQVQCVEALDAVGYEEDIRAMAAEGYNVIMIYGLELHNVGVDLADELKETNPELHIFLIDQLEDFGKENITSVSVDPFESSFVAGYLAAMTSETGTVGLIMHSDIPVMWRFSEGYYAGIKYADNGTEVHTAITGDPMDVTNAYEAALTMIDTYPVDVIYQVCYIAGTGVITACAEKGVKCIGVDVWQGDIDDCVFWSALKPMQSAVISAAQMYLDGGDMPGRININIANGNQVYDARDLEKLPAELQESVLKLVEDIKSGAVDVYATYPEGKLDY
jgi:basic membrane protein A